MQSHFQPVRRSTDHVPTFATHLAPLDELRRDVRFLRQEVAVDSRKVRRWKRGFFAAGLVAIIATGGLVAAFTAANNTWYGLAGETNTYDSNVFNLVLGAQSLLGLGGGAVGTTNSFAGAVEMLIANAGVANTALTLGHWTYSATITEAGINSFAQSATAYYKVELFLDGTSQGAVYVKNAAGDTLIAEGVIIKWDIGTNLPSTGAYVVKVSQVAA